MTGILEDNLSRIRCRYRGGNDPADRLHDTGFGSVCAVGLWNRFDRRDALLNAAMVAETVDGPL